MSSLKPTKGEWTIEFNEEIEAFPDRPNIGPRIAELVRSSGGGRIVVDENIGSPGWWKKFLGAPFGSQMHFALEWYEEVASLIFFDDAGSEYRTKDIEHHLDVDEEIRKKIAHGEVHPIPPDECLQIDRALRATSEYLGGLNRPEWLTYEYVA